MLFAAAALAFAVAWLAPSVARANMLPACDAREQVSLMPHADQPRLMSSDADPSAQPDDEADCADVPGDDSAPAGRDKAGMCDERGATMFAPQRVLPVDGGSIDAVRSCSALDALSPRARESKSAHDVPLATSSLVAVHHTTSTLGLARGYVLAPAYPPVGGRPLAGIARAIEHPPR